MATLILQALRVDCPCRAAAVNAKNNLVLTVHGFSWRPGTLKKHLRRQLGFEVEGCGGDAGRGVALRWSKEDGEKDWWSVGFWQVNVYGGERRETHCSVQNNFPLIRSSQISLCLHVVCLLTLFTSPGSWKDLACACTCVHVCLRSIR